MRTNLNRGVSVIALAAISTLGGVPAFAQGGDSIETVTVTGTSIRGTAPVGSSIITVGADTISTVDAATVTETLANIPAITGQGSTGRGQNGNGGGGASVYIHQIGASAQNSTLVIMDGHRVPITGTGNGVVDPDIIPQPMLERVEVLADGSSATYGSDAVSGVVNFITRKRFDGVQIHLQGEYVMDASLSKIGDVLIGHSWDSGSVLAAYSYSFEDNVKNVSRWQTNPLVQSQRAAADGLVTTTGSTTYFGSANCDPATIQPNASSSANIYLNAQGTTNFVNTPANLPCSTWATGDLVPSDIDHHAMMKMQQNLGPNLAFESDMIWSSKHSVSQTSRGTLTATAFGPGSGTQVNPFYVNPPGVTFNKQTIRYDFNEIFGPGAVSKAGNDVLLGDANLDWNVNDNWDVDLALSAGRSDTWNGDTQGTVNGALADLALNGSASTAGTIPTGTSAASTAVAGTQSTVNNLPLTTSNALDVWDPAATNKTSPAVLASLISPNNSSNYVHAINAYEQARLIVNGSLFNLPAGPLKIAAGLEQYNTHRSNINAGNNNTGPTSSEATYLITDFPREVSSEFAEVVIPVVSAEMNFPMVQKFDFDFAARHDAYSDAGETINPKGAFSWDVIEGLRLRGTWSTSFVATDLSHDVVPGTVAGAVSSGTPGVLPVKNYPGLVNLGIAGCTAASVTCNTSTLMGINTTGAIADLNTEKGHGWTLGADYNPSFLPGLISGVSWWHVTFLGGATAATPQIDAFNPEINNRIIIFPTSATRATPCATAAEIQAITFGAPATAPIPACVSVITITATDNLINFWASGLDASLQYTFDTDGFGHFVAGGDISQELTFLQGFGNPNTNGRSVGGIPPASERFEVANSVGLNTTFPNIGTQVRFHLDWALDQYAASISVPYTAPYKNVDSTSTVLIGQNANGVYDETGGDHVHGSYTVDLHLAYNFTTPYLGNDMLALTVSNLFNQYPPFVNGSTGYQSYNGNPLGRTISLGITAKL